MKIGIDLDGVIVDTIRFVSRELTRHLGREYTPDDIAHRLGKLEGVDKVLQERGEYLLCSLGPIERAVEAINALSEHHEVYIISARFRMHYDMTLEWMKRHKIKVKEVIFTEGKGKADICRKLEIDLFVEDSAENALEISGAGIKVILLSTEYNRAVKAAMIEHRKNWDEIFEYIASETTQMPA